MRHLICVFLFLLGANAYATSWNKSVLSQYAKTASYKDLFCSKSMEAKGCRHYQKQLGRHFTTKPLKISMTEEDTLWVHTEVSQIRVVNIAENKFLVNGHRIDLKEIESRAGLRRAIQKSLPQPVAFVGPWWMSTAWAQAYREEEHRLPVPPLLSGPAKAIPEGPGVVNLQIVATIDHLIVTSKKLSSCEEIRAFVKVCTANSDWFAQALLQTEAAWKNEHIEDKKQIIAQKKEQIKVVNEYLGGIKTLLKNIEKNRTPAFSATLNSCSWEDVALKGWYGDCVETINTAMKILPLMNKKLEEGIAAIPAKVSSLAAPSSGDGAEDEEAHEGPMSLKKKRVQKEKGGTQ